MRAQHQSRGKYAPEINEEQGRARHHIRSPTGCCLLRRRRAYSQLIRSQRKRGQHFIVSTYF